MTDALTVTVKRPGAAETDVTVDTGTAVVGTLTAAVRVIPDVDNPADFDTAEGRLAGLAGSSQLRVVTDQPFVVHYEGAAIATAEVAARRIRAGAAIAELAATASILPSRVDLTVSAAGTADVVYDASGTLATLTAAARFTTAQGDEVAVDGTVTDLPIHIVLQATNDHLQISDTTAPIGRIDLAASLNGSSAVRLDGDHVSVRSELSTQGGRPRFGASVAISGVQAAELTSGAVTTLDLQTSPGGQSLEAYADLAATDGDRHIADLLVAALPSHARIQFDAPGRTIAYDGDPTGSIAGFYTRPVLGPSILATDSGLPSHLDAQWDLTGGATSVRYSTLLADGTPAAGSQGLDAAVLYTPDGGGIDHLSLDRYVIVRAADLPAWAGLSVDATQRNARWQVAGSTGSVQVTTRNLLGTGFAARAELTDVPANWDLGWGENHGRFRALDGGQIGTAEVALATDGDIERPPAEPWWLVGQFNERDCGLELSARLAAVTTVEFSGGPTSPGSGPDAGGAGACNGGTVASGSNPVFTDTDRYPGPVAAADPPGCQLDLTDSGFTTEPTTDMCLTLGVDLAGAPLYVNAMIRGTADDQGTDPDEFTRQASGRIVGLPTAVRFARDGYRTGLAATSGPVVQLQIDLGWTAALAGPGAVGSWERGIFATDTPCPSGSCRPTRPDGDDPDTEPDDSPFCANGTCYGVRIRADIEHLPTETLADLTPYAYRLRLEGVQTTDGALAAGIDFQHARQLELRIAQHGIDPGTTLDYGPLRFLRCPGITADDLLAGLLGDGQAGPPQEPDPAEATCEDLESESLIFDPSNRLAVETHHSAPVGHLELSGTLGEPDSDEGSFGGDAVLGDPTGAEPLPATIDVDAVFGRTTRITNNSTDRLPNLSADLACRANGSQQAYGNIGFTDIPATMQLDIELLDSSSSGGGGEDPNKQTLVRFPDCGPVFPETDADAYPGGDPNTTAHVQPGYEGGCRVEQEADISSLTGRDEGEPKPIATVHYTASANTLDGATTIGGPFGLDIVDHRASDERGSNVRVDLRRATVAFDNLRSGSTITLNDDKSILLNAGTTGSLIASQLAVSTDVGVTVQQCTLDMVLHAGPATVFIDGPVGLDLQFAPTVNECVPPDPAPGCPPPSGLELRIVSPVDGFQLRTTDQFMGFGVVGGFDRVEVNLVRPEFDYLVDLHVDVHASVFGAPLGTVFTSDIEIVQHSTEILLPVFVADGQEALIAHACAKKGFIPLAGIFLYGDPTMDGYDQSPTPNQIVLEPQPGVGGYGFSLLPRDAATFDETAEPGAPTVGHPWKLNLLGASILKAVPGGGVRHEIRNGPQFCEGT